MLAYKKARYNCRTGKPDLLDKDFPQAGLPKGVVLEVESVETVKGVFVCMHVQGVDIQFVPATLS